MIKWIIIANTASFADDKFAGDFRAETSAPLPTMHCPRQHIVTSARPRNQLKQATPT